MFEWLKHAWSGDEEPGGGIGGMATDMVKQTAGAAKHTFNFLNPAVHVATDVINKEADATAQRIKDDTKLPTKVKKDAADRLSFLKEDMTQDIYGYSPEDTFAQKALKVGGSAVQTGALFVPGALGVKTMAGATGSQLAGRIGGSMAAGALGNTAFSAGQQLAETGSVSPKQLALDAAIGSVLGGAFFGATVGAGKLIKGFRKLPEGGYLRIANGEKLTPKQYRAEVINRLSEEANQFTANKKEYMAKDIGWMDTAIGNKNSSTTVAATLFKEFRKDPDKFVDKYNLIPSEMKAKSATNPKTEGVAKTLQQEIKDVLKTAPPPKAKVEMKPGTKFKIGDDEFIVTDRHYADAQKLRATAEKADPAFQTSVKQTTDKLGLKYEAGPVKGVDRTIEKTVSEYGGKFSNVKDSIRGTVTLDDPSRIDEIITAFKKDHQVLDELTKNNINSAEIGYKDTKIIIKDKASGLKSEIIIATPEMLRAKNKLHGHELYEMVRAKVGDWQRAEIAMNKLYSEASQATTKRLASASSIRVPSKSALPKVTEPPVNKLVAKTSSDLGSKSTRTAMPSTSYQRGKSVVGDVIVESPSTKSIPKKITNNNTAKDPFESILDAVHGKPAAKGQTPVKGLASSRAEKDKLLSKERGMRFITGEEAGKTTRGSEGFFKEKAALKGEYTKVDYHSMIDDIGPERTEELFANARDKIIATPDKVYDDMNLFPKSARFNTQIAVRKVLGLEPGLITPSEIRLLEVFSPKLAEEAKLTIPLHNKILQAAGELFGNVRSVKSSYDLSMGGRQSIFVAARHPVIWARANKESIQYALHPEYYKAEMRAMHNSEWGQLIDKHRKSLLTGGGMQEEAYAATDWATGKLAKKLLIGHGIAGSERAYTGGLTKLRYDIMVHDLQAYGATAAEAEARLGKDGLDGLLESVSTLTGRGGKAGGFVEKHATTLQSALFSPRLWASRLQPLNPMFWKRVGPAGRREAMQSLGAFAAVAGTVLGAFAAAGADVETDPRSSDFLKIKVGDTRYDILGGFQQNLVFGARQALGTSNNLFGTDFNTTKSSTSGHMNKYGEGFGAPTQLSAVFDMLRNKSNPVLGSFAKIAEGKDAAGNKINPIAEIASLFVPINLQGAYESIRHENSIGEGLTKGFAKNLPDTFGISTQTYGLKDVNISDVRKSYVNSLSDPVHKEAATRFFQTLKTGPDRTAASDAIKKALGDKPTTASVEKAQSIAEEYNIRYMATFKEWVKKYGDYATDTALLKEYNANKITYATIKRYLKSL